MTKSELFKKAHKIAKTIKTTFASYRMAFSEALKGVYRELSCPVKKGDKVVIDNRFCIVQSTAGSQGVVYGERNFDGTRKLNGFVGRISHWQLKVWFKNGMARKG